MKVVIKVGNFCLFGHNDLSPFTGSIPDSWDMKSLLEISKLHMIENIALCAISAGYAVKYKGKKYFIQWWNEKFVFISHGDSKHPIKQVLSRDLKWFIPDDDVWYGNGECDDRNNSNIYT